MKRNERVENIMSRFFLKKIESFYPRVFLIMFVVMIPMVCQAVDAEQEVNHLLRFVEKSGCVFVRNDKHHNAQKAREHLERKYNHIKRRVKKAEDFIKYAATKSSMSGKPYMIICDGQEVPSGEWLQAELDLYRNQSLKAVK